MKLKRSPMLVVALLIAWLALLGIGTQPAVAAPLAQSDDAGAMQVWASQLYPAASAPGIEACRS